ncbi:DUF3238 domain-containing protein [Paenibacillus agaridevorans]|uniref:DUF3238 domain-containing protein n=1 Tax=Paenibacillus agaridevorans TaxID=171404 RepID=UPI0035A22E7B
MNSNGTVSVTGKHDGFPCHEIWKKVDSNVPKALYTFQKTNLSALFGDMERSVNVSG